MVVSSYLVPSAANTPTQLSTTYTPAAWITIQARSGNTGNVRVGDSSISATAGGTVVAKGDSISLPFQGGSGSYDLREVYILVTTQGDAVDINYGQ